MKKKLAVAAIVLVGVGFCAWTILHPAPYWTAYKSVRLGMTLEEFDGIVPTPSTDEGPDGHEMFFVWEGVVEGQRHVLGLPTPISADTVLKQHPILGKSMLVRNRGERLGNSGHGPRARSLPGPPNASARRDPMGP